VVYFGPESRSLSTDDYYASPYLLNQLRFVLHSVNLILFTLLLVHLILRISPHHSHHLRSHHLSVSDALFRRIATASSSTGLRRHISDDCLLSLSLSLSRGLVRLLEARLWLLRVCWASCLSSTTSTVHIQRRSSFGIPTSSLRLLMHSRYCTGCVYQNGSTINRRLWHNEC